MFLKFISAFILVVLLAYVAYLYSSVMPWWGFAIGAFLTGIIVPQKPVFSWLSGFLGLLLTWAALAYTISAANHHILATKMASVLPAGGSPFVLILITALVAAIIAGFASLAGAYARKK